MSKTETHFQLDVKNILFSQKSISSKFKGGKMHEVSIETTINILNRLKEENEVKIGEDTRGVLVSLEEK